ncbi:hypothetical protein AAVH_11505 [Aphelenchoides avenae]|nr:hypothetical protein AAVH_11505 [Aphelenchus avenae]
MWTSNSSLYEMATIPMAVLLLLVALCYFVVFCALCNFLPSILSEKLPEKFKVDDTVVDV